ncbi:MAG: rRNA maturation RNase YbeY [Verrucomicrobia bacterium]|nr:MAG: rRNA maturation RNase YbeY [Verrucomicrobiota bacterium]
MRHRLPPSIEVRNLQRTVRISSRRLQRFAEIACALVWKHKRPEAEMASVAKISVLIASDRRMAALHKEFCGLAGPTDVLTFQHGEIVISAETAARQARIFHSSLTAEIQLYLLHGLLHLAGFGDVTAQQRQQMQRLQNKLLATAVHGL